MKKLVVAGVGLSSVFALGATATGASASQLTDVSRTTSSLSQSAGAAKVSATKTIGCTANFANTKGYIYEKQQKKSGVYWVTMYYKMESGWPGGSQNWISFKDYGGLYGTYVKKTRLGKHYSWTKLTTFRRAPNSKQTFHFHFDLSKMTDTSCNKTTTF